MTDLSKLEQILGYNFKDKNLLLQAVTHSSYANEVQNDASKDNERLEFLGDAVLDMVVSNILFKSEVDKAEGELTKLRASVVCERSLAKISKAYGFNEFILLGKGEELNGGRNRDSIVADCVEAIIGAIYIDDGFTTASQIVQKFFKDEIAFAEEGRLPRDSKTELQEKLQANGPCKIDYELVGESGPDHDKTFRFIVKVDGKQIGEGQGKSKKEAQANAAEAALKGI